MEELEKEKIYTEALERLTSALSNEDIKREALAALASLGDYRRDKYCNGENYENELVLHRFFHKSTF